MISRGSALGALGTTVVHGALALLAPEATARPAPPPAPVEFVLDAPPPPPPPPPAEPPPPAPVEPPPAPAAPVAKAPAAPRAEPARATPVAQAGKALVADASDPNEVADFSLATGSGATFAGGTTSSTGTGREPGRPAAAVAPAAPAAPAPAPAAPAVDRSRPARPGAGDWNCSHLFPADDDAPDTAAVSLVVTVKPDGSAGSIAVVNDPGHGFGAAARRCALGQRFEPALDPAGQPTAGPTRPFTVRFRR